MGDAPSQAAARQVVFLRALNSAVGRTPLWILSATVVVLLSTVLALPSLAWFREALDQRYEPGSVLRALDETFRFDHREARATLERSLAGSAAVLALLAMLFGAFSAGGWLQVFLERTQGQSLRRFFFGGSRYFFRFLRVLLLTLLTLHLLGWLFYGRPWEVVVGGWMLDLPDGDLHGLESELSARQIVLARDALFFLLAGLVFLWGDYTRTRLALHDTSSAVWAGLCSWATLIAHPIRAVRPMLLLWLVEAAVLAAAAVVTRMLQARLEGSQAWLPVLLLFVLGLVVILWRSIVRGARYAAALDVSAQLVRPLARPDPWKQSLGGPGGPRYPIGEDEYSVSL